jgi:hypothetical protein
MKANVPTRYSINYNLRRTMLQVYVKQLMKNKKKNKNKNKKKISKANHSNSGSKALKTAKISLFVCY